MLAFHASVNECYTENDEKWILDSGASAHISFKKEYFQDLSSYKGPSLKLGNQEAVKILGQGNILIKRFVAGQWEIRFLKNVLYVPDFKRNLFSEGVIARQGYQIVKRNNDALIYNGNDLVMCASLERDNLYELNIKAIQQQKFNRCPLQPSVADSLRKCTCNENDTKVIRRIFSEICLEEVADYEQPFISVEEDRNE